MVTSYASFDSSTRISFSTSSNIASLMAMCSGVHRSNDHIIDDYDAGPEGGGDELPSNQECEPVVLLL